jgi:hypothetical protein
VNKFYKSKTDGSVFKNMFVGMDVHKNYLQVAVLDEKGKAVSNSRVYNNLIKVNEFFDTLHPGNNTKEPKEYKQMARTIAITIFDIYQRTTLNRV